MELQSSFGRLADWPALIILIVSLLSFVVYLGLALREGLRLRRRERDERQIERIREWAERRRMERELGRRRPGGFEKHHFAAR